MLRLLYLLIRQRLRRAQAAQRHASLRGASTWIVALVAALASALGAVAYVLHEQRQTTLPATTAAAPQNAALRLQVARVETVPLVVYLEAPGRSAAAADDGEHAAAQLTSINAVFEPAFQVAHVATRIQVGNADPVAHNTHVFDGRRTLFNIALPLQDMRVTKTLARPGLFEVRCDLHPWMRATLFVPPNRHHVVIRAPGEFVLRDVAPGSYRLHAWAPGRGRTTSIIELPAGAERTLEVAPR